ncbi:hypothetical protein DXG01_004989 [Tephrocybe rancida]|nr:hypothetical protein DXG01_004989 [Tephrocybe rancida]
MSSPQEHLLPAETWTHVASHLSFSDQVAFLGVSRMFHSIATRFVFACITIHFVDQSFTETFETDPYFFDDMESVTQRLLRHSWEKLEYIIDNPFFGKWIKTLSVIASSDSPSVFEQLTLAKALKTMPNLKTFYWFEHLRSMRIQHLQIESPHISPRMDSTEPDLTFWIDNLDIPSNTIAALESLWSPYLRRLSILSKHIDGMSLLGFGLLTELELYVTDSEVASELTGLDLVFHHAPMLESLSVVGLVSQEIFLLLPSDPAILSRLKSFRLSAETWSLAGVSEAHILRLSRFLERKLSLRRLSLYLGGARWTTISLLLPTLRQLQALEVFGLHAGGLSMNAGDFEVLASLLTFQMTSIQLVIPWDYPDTSDADVTILAPLLQRLKELPSLKFIHLYSLGILPIIPQDLVTDLVHLHTLGYYRSLWDVHDSCLSEWAPWKVRYAKVEDFDCSDDAWLFKHL